MTKHAWMACLPLLGVAGCSGPPVNVVPADSDASSTGGPGSSDAPAPTTVAPADGTTTAAEATQGTTSAGTTGTGTEPSGHDTVAFLFDVGGGIATGEPIPDLPPLLDYDCDDLTQPFISETELASPRGYHDVYFDDAGHILGWDGGAIVRVTYDDSVSVFLPGVSGVQGMDVLANGDLLFVNNNGELRRVTPVPQSTVVTSGLTGAYGITVGPDQQAYVATNDSVRRVDPDTGASTSLFSLPSGHTPRAVVFNLDSTALYISTLTFDGVAPVYIQAVDASLDPVGQPSIFASNVGQGWHDGLGIDACGNLYVPDYNTAGLYRIDPLGTVTMLYNETNAAFEHYGHGLEWGSGIDGWNDHAIYLPQPYDGNTVNEVVLGVPSGSTVRTWR